jgi:hypothetical protein
LKHAASPDFWVCYRALPVPVQELANRVFTLLKKDPSHPSLHVKRVGRFWSTRIGLRHRAFATEAPQGLVWFWIRTHAEYDRLIPPLLHQVRFA